MKNTIGFPDHSPGQRHCEVCGCQISHHDSLQQRGLEYAVCHSFDCKRIMSQKPSMSPAMFASHLDFQSKLVTQRRAKEAEKQRYVETISSIEQQENQRIFKAILKDKPELTRETTHLVPLPSGLSRLSCPSEDRINDYTQHLHAIIHEASEYASTAEVVYDQHNEAHRKLAKVEQLFNARPELRTVSDQLCGQCKGGCCTTGKDHSYLSVVTVRRYMDNHLAVSEQQLLDLYLSYLNPETVAGSCINQTGSGCALPRELRSDVCNSYYCEGIKEYQQNLQDHQEPGVIVAIQRANTNWNRFYPDTSNAITEIVLVEQDRLQTVNTHLSD